MRVGGMRIVQLVVTDNFAGTERYVAQTSGSSPGVATT